MKILRLTSSLIATICLLGADGRAEELRGLDVGAKAPAFELKDQDGKPVKSVELLKQGPVALVFYRSADW